MSTAHESVMPASAQHTPVSVVFLTGQFHPVQGGSEVAALREAKALRARGHDVRVVTLRWKTSWPRDDVIEGVPVRRIGGLFLRGRLRSRFGAKWLVEALLWLELVRSRDSYDVMHLRMLRELARPALLAARLARKPVIARVANSGRGPDRPVRRDQPFRLFAGDLDPRSPFLVCRDMSRNGDLDDLRHSQWLAGLTLRLLRHRRVTFMATSTRIRSDLIRYGFRPEKIAVLPTCVDLDAFQETAQRVRTRAAADGAPVVLCVGHYRYEKGLDILLHAWRHVHARVPGVQLVLAGQGQLEPQLREMCAALRLNDCVRFAGMIYDVRSVLAEADVFVLPSRYEGLSNALLEAMASSLPCVATRVSGSEDVIVDGENGLLVPSEDPDALASALLALLTDRERARAIGEAGWRRIAQSYNQPQMTERLGRLYAAVTSGGAADSYVDPQPAPLLSTVSPRPKRAMMRGELRTYQHEGSSR